MSAPEFKQPPPPYSEVASPPVVGGTTYGFQYPPNQPPPPGFEPTVQQPMPGYPPQAGYQPQPGAPGYGTATFINVQPPTEVILINGCPNCRVGVLEEEYSCLGIFCAIFFFPLGMLCCLLMRERRCTNCRAQF